MFKFSRKRTQIQKPNSSNLEIALPLYCLGALRQRRELFDELLRQIMRAVELPNPFRISEYDEEIANLFEAKIRITAMLGRDFGVSRLDDYTIYDFSDKINQEFSSNFREVMRCYQALTDLEARELLNKPLSYIRDHPSQSTRIVDLKNAVDELNLGKASSYWDYENWLDLEKKVAQDCRDAFHINTLLGAICNVGVDREQLKFMGLRTLISKIANATQEYEQRLSEGIEQLHLIVYDLLKMELLNAFTKSLFIFLRCICDLADQCS